MEHVAMHNEHLLHRTGLRSFLEKQQGKFVTVEFIKLDATRRVLNGRLGVETHHKGGESTVERPYRPYLTVYDVKRAGYRAVNLETVDRVRANGTEYTIIG